MLRSKIIPGFLVRYLGYLNNNTQWHFSLFDNCDILMYIESGLYLLVISANATFSTISHKYIAIGIGILIDTTYTYICDLVRKSVNEFNSTHVTADFNYCSWIPRSPTGRNVTGYCDLNNYIILCEIQE